MARWALVLALVGAWWAPAQLMEPPHCAAAVRCAAAGSSQSEYIYIVDGFTVYLEYTDSGYFKLKCTAGLRLDNSALPTFESQLRVNKVYFEDCPSPQSSYADVLERFNVVVLEKMTLTKIGNLTATHFAQLQHLHKLELLTAALAPGALSALSQLQYLLLDSVRTAPGELRRLPASLETLSLMRMGMDVTAADLAALPRLDYLVVRDPANVRVDASAAPRMLSLDLPAAVLARELSPSLRKLTVFGWGEAHPAPWLQCALESLDVRDALAEELPPGWLARCSALRSLRVDSAARLVRLEPGALRGAVELRELHVVSTALQYLPPGLLDDLPQLKLLDLSSNRLLELPGGLFARTNSLESLNLSSNQLTQGVLSSLSAVTSLVSLDLSNNNLKDSCGSKSDAVRGSSPLQYLKLLRKLVLKNTNISMICRDWRENMPQLKTLDLTDNLFEYITFADMQFYGTTNVSVDLQRNNVSVLEYTREDYKSAVDLAKPELRAHLSLSSRLRCDCHVYWAARAFHERPQHARLTALCADGSQLARAPAALECAGAPPGVRCAAPCACAWRPGERAVLRVRCEGAALRSARALRAAVSAPRGLAVDWELYLANNNIERVELDDLPPNVTVLDLRNNSVSSLSVRTARELVQRGLRLAGNPLHCGCGAADVLAVLRARLADLPRATCRDGGAAPARLAAGAARAGRRRAPLRRLRVLLARRRALRALAARGAPGERPRALPPLSALPRLGAGRLDPGADRGLGPRLAPHRGRRLRALPALQLGARRVPRGARAGAAVGAAAAGGGAAAGAGAPAAGRAPAAVPGRQHLRALGRPVVLGEAVPGAAARPRPGAGWRPGGAAGHDAGVGHAADAGQVGRVRRRRVHAGAADSGAGLACVRLCAPGLPSSRLYTYFETSSSLYLCLEVEVALYRCLTQ